MKQDKLEHFLMGFFFSVLGLLYSPFVSLGYIAGAAKEIMDIFGDGKFEWMDLVATWAGAAIATLIVFSL